MVTRVIVQMDGQEVIANLMLMNAIQLMRVNMETVQILTAVTRVDVLSIGKEPTVIRMKMNVTITHV